MSKIKQQIGEQEFCIINTEDDQDHMMVSDRIFTPDYAKGVYAYNLLNRAALKSPRLYKRLVTYFNKESGFVTLPLNIFRQYRFVSSFLYFKFKEILGGIHGTSLIALYLVKRISEYSLTIPPYIHNFIMEYSNEEVCRIDALDSYFDINDINFVKYKLLNLKILDLSKTEELEMSEFRFKRAFSNLKTEEKLAEH